MDLEFVTKRLYIYIYIYIYISRFYRIRIGNDLNDHQNK